MPQSKTVLRIISMPISKRNRWIYWIKLLAGIALVVVLFQEINRRESILSVLQETDLANILLCIMLLIPNIFLAFLKWRYLLRRRYQDTTSYEVFGSLLFGYTLGLVTPGRLGELARGLFFTNKDRLIITGLNLLDKAANQIVIFTLGGISLGFMILKQNIWEVKNILPLLLTGSLIIIISWLIILNPDKARRLLAFLNSKLPRKFNFSTLISAYDQISLKDILVVVGLTLAWFIVIVLQYHILVLAFTDAAFTESFQAVTAMLFVKTLVPLTFGDLGIREGVSVFFYSQFGVSQAAVFNASLLIFLINFLTPALSGLYYVLQVKTTNGLSEEASLDQSSKETAADI